MKDLERIILRLKTLKLSVRSEASKLLLEECINDLTELDKQLFEEEQAKKIPPTFKIGDKVRLNQEKLPQKLSAEGQLIRFYINMVTPKGLAWCVDVLGKEDPRYIPVSLLMLAED